MILLCLIFGEIAIKNHITFNYNNNTTAQLKPDIFITYTKLTVNFISAFQFSKVNSKTFIILNITDKR